jgi:photosystem II stability/assembly factor-like uncharacterized protein
MRKTSWFPAGRISAVLCVSALLASQAIAGDVSKSTKAKTANKPVPIGKSINAKNKLQRYDQPGDAQQYYADKRSPDGRPVDPSLTFHAIEAVQLMPMHSTASESAAPANNPNVSSPSDSQPNGSFVSFSGGLGGSWQHLGPGNVGGRTRSLVINPGNPNIMWAAGVGGGIWKSTDGGASWTPKGDLLQNIAISTLIQDPRNPDVLYAGTGEGYYNIDAIRGAGIFKSTDGGETWNQLASTANSAFYYVQKLAITKGATQRIYAATRDGLFRSTDGGATFTKVFDSAAAGLVRGCMDIVIQTDRALAYVVAACGHPFSSAEPAGAIYRALDTSANMTWQKVFTQTNMARTSLALAPSNNAIVYAMASSKQDGNYNTGFLGVFRSASSGASGSWTTQVLNTDSNKLNTVQLSNPVYAFLADCGFGSANQFLNQGWYDNQIAVDPKDPNIVWTAGIDLMRSDDAGKSWGLASYWWAGPGVDPEYSHADNHVFAFHPGYDGVTNQTLIVGSDGGIYKTNNARAVVYKTLDGVCGNIDPATDVNWTSLNHSYSVTQFYDGVAYPDGNTFFGGTQDNGTPRGTIATGANGWTSIIGGDGGYVAVDPTNTNTLYGENTALSFKRSDNGGASFTTRTSGITEGSGNFNFIAPFTMDPSNPSRLYIAGAYPWKTENKGNSWTRDGAFFGARIGSIAVSPSNSNHVVMGTSAPGTIFYTTTALTNTTTTNWASSKPRNGWVAWIAIDPNNDNNVYAVYSTFNSGVDVGHVFKSTDGGATWSNIDGSGATGIPDVPVSSIAIDPANSQRIYIGTDIGVFVTIDGGANWARENTGFANVATESLKIQDVGGGVRYLYAFTHGRGAWRVQLP